ncbi:phasin family protein [Caballeronia sp. Lep1P3]|uniref:phasin family protein n=1 Tax=Caballeronia sp. Lep1P3 TaxID=2878150 RepID=UPI001FCFC962|nr:phasin family protein [Caballeronia sp. Lep1P3]
MFQYPGFSAYQIPSIARANLQAFLNASDRLASGMQALAELNVQTVRKVLEESNSLLHGGDETGAGDVLAWQSVMFAQLPQKAASYGQHVLSIITSTEADIIGEVRSQYERNGISLKGFADAGTNEAQQTAHEAAQEATQETSLVVTNLAETASEAAQQTSGVILDASGQIANESSSAAKQPGEAAENATAKAARASSRRPV